MAATNRYFFMYPNSKARPAAMGLLLAASPLLVGALQAQSQTPPAFEVASVKQDKSHQWVRRPWSPNIDCGPVAKCGLFGNRFSDQVASLDDLIMDAYKVKRFQISGLPAWGDTGTDVYDVEATLGGDRTSTLDEARVMLQTLLADRFQLKIHRETRELPVYALVVGRNGPKLAPSETPCDFPPPPGGGAGRGGGKKGGLGERSLTLLDSWALIPELIGGRVDRPVLDKSGLTASTYCTLDGLNPLAVVLRELGPGASGRGGASARPPDAADDPGASIFTVIEEKWGLKLEKQKGPVDILVIDHVDRPTEN